MNLGKWKYGLKRKLTAILLVMCIFVLTSCSSEGVQESSESVEEPTGIKIGMSFDSFIIERWRRDCDVFVAKIKEYDSNADVNVQNANGDIETQKAQIRYLIEKKYDVIVIVCIDSDSLSDVCEEAKSAGISIIAYDRLIKNANVDLYISFDNEKVGTLMGEALVKDGLPKKKVLMLSGPNEDNNVSMVESGFRSVMEENNITIVDCVHAPGWKAEAAAEYINAHLTELGNVDAIMCGSGSATSTGMDAQGLSESGGQRWPWHHAGVLLSTERSWFEYVSEVRACCGNGCGFTVAGNDGRAGRRIRRSGV